MKSPLLTGGRWHCPCCGKLSELYTGELLQSYSSRDVAELLQTAVALAASNESAPPTPMQVSEMYEIVIKITRLLEVHEKLLEH